jgi:hypothetical protein
LSHDQQHRALSFPQPRAVHGDDGMQPPHAAAGDEHPPHAGG